MLFQRITKPTEVRLSDVPALLSGAGPVVQVLRTGKFQHPEYGEFEITPVVLADMVRNFKENIRGVDIAVDYFHRADEEAAGWIKELILMEGGTELWAKLDWTPAAQKKLNEREIRYFSPDFAFQWKDPESGSEYKNVLFGGGLTNRPFVKDMAAIVAAETKGETMKKLEDVVADLASEVKKLSEGQAAIAQKLEDPAAGASGAGDGESELEKMKKQLASVLAENAQLKEASAKLGEEKKVAEAAKVLAEKETAFNVLLTEGKACAAQKEAFVKGDMTEFLKLAQPVNLNGSGDSGSQSKDDLDEEKTLKLAEEKRKASNGKLTLGEAILEVRRENKK